MLGEGKGESKVGGENNIRRENKEVFQEKNFVTLFFNTHTIIFNVFLP